MVVTGRLYNAQWILKGIKTMSSQDSDGQQGLILALVFGVLALVIALVMGVGIYQRKQSAVPVRAFASTPAVSVSVAPSASLVNAVNAAQAAADAASVKVEYGVVKFYFASGKAELAAGAGEALADLVKGAQTGRKLAISGFHDASGSPAKNAELAKLRAFAVRDALKAAGVAEQKIELKTPEQMTASASDAEARRVEVALE